MRRRLLDEAVREVLVGVGVMLGPRLKLQCGISALTVVIILITIIVIFMVRMMVLRTVIRSVIVITLIIMMAMLGLT